MWTTPDGFILFLPRSGLAKIISRLPASGLNGLLENSSYSSLMEGVVSSIGQLAKNAHRSDDIRHVKSSGTYFVFSGEIDGGRYQILARPLNARQNAIVFVNFESGTDSEDLKAKDKTESEAPAITNNNCHPNVLKGVKVLQKEAKDVFFKSYPRLEGKVEVWHRFPLEWRRLFPKVDPNRLSNLIALTHTEQHRKAKNLWEIFQKAFRRRGMRPTAKEVWKQVRRVDQELFSQWSSE